MKWPLSKLYKDNAAAAATPHPLHCVQHLLLKEKALGWPHFPTYIKKCVPPHPSCYTLDTFPRLGEGFYRYALCKKLGCSCQLPHSTTPDSCIQPCPVARRCNRRGACVARPKGKNEKLPGGACSYPGNLSFSLPRGRGGRWPGPRPVFIQLTFTSPRSLLWYFLGLQESTVPLRPFPVFPAYAISSISYSRVPMPSFSPCSRPACQLVSGNSAVK